MIILSQRIYTHDRELYVLDPIRMKLLPTHKLSFCL